jgi:hypothetical protein
MIIVHLLEERPLQISAHVLRVHEIAVAAAIACALIVLSALGLTEICDGRELSHDDLASVVPAEEPLHGCHRLVLALILDIDVADHVLADVVRDHHLLELPELGKLGEHFFIKVLEMVDRLDQTLLRHIQTIGKGDRRRGVIVEMRENHGL